MGRLFRRTFLLVTLSSLAPSAQAYLDPGTGVLVVQAAIGAIAGALVAAKLYWTKIKAGWRRLIGRGSSAGCSVATRQYSDDPNRPEDDAT